MVSPGKISAEQIICGTDIAVRGDGVFDGGQRVGFASGDLVVLGEGSQGYKLALPVSESES